jgi:TonB family protein
MRGRTAQLMVAAAALALAGGAARGETGRLLTAAEANQVAAAHAPEVRGCYFRHALAEPRATGQVRIALQVTSGGAVASARVEAPGLVRRAFARCVLARAFAWRFPPSSAATEVQMPFRFHIPVRLRARARPLAAGPPPRAAQSSRRKR